MWIFKLISGASSIIVYTTVSWVLIENFFLLGGTFYNVLKNIYVVHEKS